MKNMLITEQDYCEFCKYLESRCAIVLGENKHYLVKSRLSPLLSRYRLPSMAALFQALFLNKDKELAIAAIDAMTTNETLWFRDTYPFEVLSNKLLPEMAKNKRPIKIWSAASASGQEAYSIAMTIQELQFKKPNLVSNVSIIATDISLTMLDNCRAGIYDNLALNRGLSVERKRRFFEDVGDARMKLKDPLKRMVTFKSLNLMDSYASLGKFDLIFCRNVLIYFSPEMKMKVLNQMAASLHPGGYLLLGASESLTGFTDKFEMIRCNPGIIYKLK